MHAERLRASSPEHQPRVEAVTGREAVADPRTDALLDFADAVNAGRAPQITKARLALADLIDPATMVDAAAVIAAFEGFNRVADATGCRLGDHEDLTAEVRARLDLDAYDTAAG